MFYSEFSEDYEQIFPFRESVFSFLKEYMPSDENAILDIGCASGHYCGKFADRGYRIIGIDLDPDMIGTAVQSYPDADFRVLDLVNIGDLDSKFAMVYSIGNVMAHVPADNFKEFLVNLKGKMINNGIWIFQVINWDYILQRDRFTFPVIETKDKIFYRHYSDISRDSLVFNTELKSGNRMRSVFKDSVKMYPVSSEEYLSIHSEAGFNLLGHFSDFGKSEFDPGKHSADIYVFEIIH